MRIFGFDMGTTSVGAAVVDYVEDSGEGQVTHLSVRIFPEGVTEKKREPRNKARRTARMVRRQLRRRRVRRAELGRLLADAGLLPRFGGSDWSDAMGADPYELRARGLTEKLETLQVGRALYHLAKRRGFTSARIEEQSEAGRARKKDEGIVKEHIGKLRELMAGRTLGAYLATRVNEKKRGDYIGRDMVKAEFAALWAAQAPHHLQQMTERLRTHIEQVMFHQRPVFWRLNTLGHCRLEPEEESLCLNGSWHGQQFVMLQALNNLKFSGIEAPLLTQPERAKAYSLLQAQAELTFGALRKAPGMRDAKFNFEEGGEKKLRGNATEAALRKVFGKAWDAHPTRDRIRSEIADRLWEVEYRRIGNKRVEIRPDADAAVQREIFVQAAQAEYGISREQAVALADLGGKLRQGWLRFSRKAIEKLLIPLEAGKPTPNAIEEAYPGHREHGKETRDRLPSKSAEMPDIRNPTVTRALTELRKVTNNLLAVYGKPDLIRIELARDLKLPKRVRIDIQKRQKELEVLRENARADLTEKGIDPSRDDKEKWMLWKECKETCPYTGRKIGFDALFRRGEFQVEHIFPRSRSLDNGFGNKTLCEADFNKAKGNRTPFEYLGHNPKKWEELKAHLKSIDFPDAKTRRFLNRDLEAEGSEELAERQLRDTSYIAREARSFLERLGVPVQATNGRVTAQLRHFWGLNTILGTALGGKNREDHRHHAVDALVVALSSPAFIKRLSTYYSRERHAPGQLFPAPWATLRTEAEAKVGKLIVSHRVRRKVSGALHAQTAYGDTEEEVTRNGITYRRYVTRVSLAAEKNKPGITPGQIEDIRDPIIRKLVQAHVLARGGDPKKAFPPFPVLISKKDSSQREIRRVRLYVDQQSKLMANLRPEGNSYADLDANHHMSIFDLGDGKATFEIVSRFEATRRKSTEKEIVQRARKEGGKFVMSLSIGDTVHLVLNGEPTYVVVQKLSANGQVFFLPHAAARAEKAPPSLMAGPLLRARARKVSVDPIGRVRLARD